MMNYFRIDWAAWGAEHRRMLAEDHRQFGDLFPTELPILPIGCQNRGGTNFGRDTLEEKGTWTQPTYTPTGQPQRLQDLLMRGDTRCGFPPTHRR